MNYPKVYALNYLIKRDKLNIFYINCNNLYFNILIIYCINFILVFKYNNHIFFCL